MTETRKFREGKFEATLTWNEDDSHANVSITQEFNGGERE